MTQQNISTHCPDPEHINLKCLKLSFNNQDGVWEQNLEKLRLKLWFQALEHIRILVIKLKEECLHLDLEPVNVQML